jgi:hypothetical protein
MSDGTPYRGATRGLAIVAASIAGLAFAGPGSAQLGAAQSQSGSNGTLQAVVTNVEVTANTVQAPVAVDAPIRVLSPGSNSGGGADSEATRGAGSGGSASQSQSGSDGTAQVGVTNVQVAGNTVQAPVRVVGPIRILSPGEDRGDASATATAGGGGSPEQSQNGENGALQALLTSLQVAGATVQTPIAVYAPIRVLSPGDDGGGASASAGAAGGGGSTEQSQNGENGTAQAGVTNAQVADNMVQAPVDVAAPVRVLSPGGTATGPGSGGSPGGGGSPPAGGGGPGGGELGADAGSTASRSGSAGEVLAAVTGGGSLPYTGAPFALLVLLGTGLLLAGARLRAAGTELRP